MYRLMVWYRKHWKWGLKEYDTIEEAAARVKELKAVGIKAKVAKSSELFN